MTEPTKVTELERAACTILLYHMGKIMDGPNDLRFNSALYEWMEKVCSDEDYSDYGHMLNHNPNTSRYKRAFDWDTALADLPEHMQLYYSGMAKAAHHLANAICRYRERDRQGGEHTTYLTGGSAETGGISVTTSLAARIAEFHAQAVQMQHYMYM